jgi:hypothetical protein
MKYQQFDRVNDMSFDAWMWAQEEMLSEILADASLRYEEVSIEFVVHKQRTKNEYSSMVSLMKAYQRLTKCEVDDTTIETGKRVVVKGKKMTKAMHIKQNLITLMLKCAKAQLTFSFRYKAVDVKSTGHAIDVFMLMYNNVQTKAQKATSNVIVFPTT